MKYPTSPLSLQTHDLPSPFFRIACRLLPRSFATIPHLNTLFSIACSLFSKNTRVGGASAPDHPQLTTPLPTFFKPLFSTFYESLPIPHRCKNHLFSCTYKSLFAQPLCFLIYTKPPGCGGQSAVQSFSVPSQRTPRLCVISSAKVRRRGSATIGDAR